MTPFLRRGRPWLLLAGAVLLAALVTTRRPDTGPPLDARSTGPLGARGLVLVLEELGARVELTNVPGPGADTALLLSDHLDEASRARLLDWVGAGGTVVVADPRSELAPLLERPSNLFGSGDGSDRGLTPHCSLPALAEVGRIDLRDALPFRPPEGGVGCFPVGEGFALVARGEGAGTVVAVGGAHLFLNSSLDEADNSVLAVSLLAPKRGTVVAFLEPPPPGSGERSVLELVSPRVKAGLAQLVVGFALFALWRARRLGRPVTEPQPVEVAGSELVVAVGNLLQQARRRDAAGEMLRVELRRTLADRLGLPPDSPGELLAEGAAARTGLRAERVAAALESRPFADEAELVTLAQSVEEIRKELAHAR